jgi:hypothetical protein
MSWPNDGDIVYFKIAQDSMKRSHRRVSFKGFGWGILLGGVPPFSEDISKEFLIQSLGAKGFVSLDDIGEILGAEQGRKLLEAVEKKYTGNVTPDETVTEELDPEIEAAKMPPKLGLVDPSGRPVGDQP